MPTDHKSSGRTRFCGSRSLHSLCLPSGCSLSAIPYWSEGAQQIHSPFNQNHIRWGCMQGIKSESYQVGLHTGDYKTTLRHVFPEVKPLTWSMRKFLQNDHRLSF